MFTTPDVRQVANWLRKALSGEPSKARPNQQTTHVEAFTEGQQDAGSIPAASIKAPSVTGGAFFCLCVTEDDTSQGLVSPLPAASE